MGVQANCEMLTVNPEKLEVSGRSHNCSMEHIVPVMASHLPRARNEGKSSPRVHTT